MTPVYRAWHNKDIRAQMYAFTSAADSETGAAAAPRGACDRHHRRLLGRKLPLQTSGATAGCSCCRSSIWSQRLSAWPLLGIGLATSTGGFAALVEERKAHPRNLQSGARGRKRAPCLWLADHRFVAVDGLARGLQAVLGRRYLTQWRRGAISELRPAHLLPGLPTLTTHSRFSGILAPAPADRPVRPSPSLFSISILESSGEYPQNLK